MSIRNLAGCLTAALALVVTTAHADIYTWIDKKGLTNVSNLPPPEDAKVTNVQRAAPKDAAREAAAREALRQAEVRVLNEKVQQLQDQVEQARRDPPVLAYAPPPPYASAPTVNIVNVTPQAQPSYAPSYSGCDYSFGDCFGGWPGYWGGTTTYIPGRIGKPYRRANGFGNPGNNQIVPPLIPLPSPVRMAPPPPPHMTPPVPRPH